jgi:hypothetical protein
MVQWDRREGHGSKNWPWPLQLFLAVCSVDPALILGVFPVSLEGLVRELHERSDQAAVAIARMHRGDDDE